MKKRRDATNSPAGVYSVGMYFMPLAAGTLRNGDDYI